MSIGALRARLLSVAELVRQGAVFADIGTDHAHLPIFLLESGRIGRAVCSDINKGPLDSAKRNAAEAELSDRMEFVLTDGAAALADRGITDYAICGMGGELIAEIIDKAPQLKDGDISLILQPMSKQAHLRKYLYKNGFSIITESYSSEGERHYVAMLVRYTGEIRDLNDVESEIGPENIGIINESSRKSYLIDKKRSLYHAIDGKAKGGESVADEFAIVFKIIKILDKMQENGL